MLSPDLLYCHPDLFHVVFGLFNGGFPVPLSPPSLHVLGHLVVPSLLFLDLVAQFTVSWHVIRIIDQLQATSFARSIFLVALLSEVTPFPVTTLPPRLFEVAHCGGEADEVAG